jgi:hypothetical protein
MLYTDIRKTLPPVPITEESQVVFLHIPKTAGTSFERVLRSVFKSDQICPYHLTTDLFENPVEHITGYKLYAGHFYHYVIKRFVTGNAIYLTFLRDPVERTLSYYYQVQRNGYDNPGFGISLEKFVFDPRLNSQFINLQSRMLGANPEFSGIENLKTDWIKEHQEMMGGKHATAEEVLPVLKSFSFFGITERFNDSIALLSYTFGWLPLFNTERLNVGNDRPDRDQIPTKIIDKIIELNLEDVILYKNAAALFNARFSDMVQQLAWQNHKTFQISLTPRVQELTYHFDKLAGEGWYLPEQLPDGTYFSWSGPETCSVLELPLAEEVALAVRFCVAGAVSEDILYSLRVSINHYPVALTHAYLNQQFIFQGVLPRDAVQHDRYFSEIAFEVSETKAPRNGQGEDKRKLGVAFKWLQILPAEKLGPS